MVAHLVERWDIFLFVVSPTIWKSMRRRKFNRGQKWIWSFSQLFLSCIDVLMVFPTAADTRKFRVHCMLFHMEVSSMHKMFNRRHKVNLNFLSLTEYLSWIDPFVVMFRVTWEKMDTLHCKPFNIKAKRTQSKRLNCFCLSSTSI